MYSNNSSLGTTLSIPITNSTGQHNNAALNAVLGILMLISTYFLTALAFHGYSTRGQMVNGDAGTHYTKKLRILCYINFMLTTSHAISALIVYNDGAMSTLSCNIMKNLLVLILLTLDATIYSFLWVRQYVVYENMHFRSKLERWIMNCLEYSSIVIIIGIFLTSCGIIFGYRRYQYDPQVTTCISVTPHNMELALSYVWTFGSVVLHSVLVLLFVYPLVRLLQIRNASIDIIRPNSDDDLGRMVRRCLLISITCVVTDVIVMLISEYSTVLSHNSQLRHCIYNANVLFNSMAIVLTFKEWRSMFLPWF